MVRQILEKIECEREWILIEKNVPTNPSLWSKFKSQAKAKFDVYPSAYANGWAAKQYKAAGGGWKSVSEELSEETDEYVTIIQEEGEKKVSEIYESDWQRDFESARLFSSWTSTYSIIVFMTMFYYYVGMAIATEPGDDVYKQN